MKITFSKYSKQKGSAVIVVIALLFVLVSIMAINQRVLFQLHRQIEIIEQGQLKKYNVTTNAAIISPTEKNSVIAPEKK